MSDGVGNDGQQTRPKKKRTLRNWLTQFGVSLILALIVIAFTQDIFFEIGPLKRLELSTIDFRFRLRGPLPSATESTKVIIVEISEESFKSLPDRYPWPHSYYAHLVKNLKRAGALAVGFDLVFDQYNAKDSTGYNQFRDIIKETGFVVVAGKIKPTSDEYTVRTAEENYNNIFFTADSSIGIVNVLGDDDGIQRRYVPFYYDRTTERRVPSFGFAVLNKVFNRAPFNVAKVTPKEFLFEDRHIPRYDPISYLINYYGPNRTYLHIKFADVLDSHEFTTVEEKASGEEINTFDDPDIPGYLYDGTFKNKVVLIGSTMPEDHDMFAVPMAKGKRAGDNLMYGVEVHANAIQNVLDGNFLLNEPRWVDILAILFCCSLTFFATTIIKEIKFRYQILSELSSATFAIVELGVIFFASVKLFSNYNYVATITNPGFGVVIGYFGATVYNFIAERKQKAMIKGMFSLYVNPTVVNELITHPEKMRLGGERKELTVLFSDIEGFTSISEQSTPETLVPLLNEYLTEMTSIIFKNAGTLDKYIGDAVMAFWGAPIHQDNHAINACKAALEMIEVLKPMREKWKSEGRPAINIRIGLSTGDMIVGNMGGKERFDYTVIGDTVNLGSRLESANKQYHTRIMMSEQTYKRTEGKVVGRELDMIIVVGKTEPIKVFELIALSDAKLSDDDERFLELYAKALTVYRQRKWDEAIELLEKGVKIKPDDNPSQIYIERARLYQAVPPPDDWNGVFILRSK